MRLKREWKGGEILLLQLTHFKSEMQRKIQVKCDSFLDLKMERHINQPI